MRLGAWDIEVVDEPADASGLHGTSLDIQPQPLRWYAAVRVGDYFGEQGTPEEQRHVAVHEILHLTQARTFEWFNQGILTEWLPMATGNLLINLLREDMEVATDFVARLIEESMPLPPDSIIVAAEDSAAGAGQTEENAQDSAKMGQEEGTHQGAHLGETPENDTSKVDQPARRNPTTGDTSSEQTGALQ